MARGSIERSVSERTGRVSWRARLSYTDGTGRRRHRSRSFPTRKRADAWLNAEILAIETGGASEGERRTVAEVFERWIAHAETRLAPSTTRTYREWYRLAIAPAIGSRVVGRVTSAEIQALYDDLAGRYSAHSHTAIRIVARGIFRTALADGMIRVDPTAGRRHPAVRRSTARKGWTVAEARRFVAGAEPGRDDLWLFMLATGIRLGEAIALAWGDVDVAERRAFIRRTASRGPQGWRIVETTKTRSSRRTIALPRLALDVLERIGAGEPDSLVFTWQGERIKHHSSRLRLAASCRRIGVPEITPHGLRHTYGTVALHEGVHPKIVSEQLGHASIAITLDLYSHSSTALARQAADALDRALAGPADD